MDTTPIPPAPQHYPPAAPQQPEKKPFYKEAWFWLVMIFAFLFLCCTMTSVGMLFFSMVNSGDTYDPYYDEYYDPSYNGYYDPYYYDMMPGQEFGTEPYMNEGCPGCQQGCPNGSISPSDPENGTNQGGTPQGQGETTPQNGNGHGMGNWY